MEYKLILKTGDNQLIDIFKLSDILNFVDTNFNIENDADMSVLIKTIRHRIKEFKGE